MISGVYCMAMFNNLPQTNARVGMLMADFSGLEKLDEIVREKMKRLVLSDQVQKNSAYVGTGNWSLEQFDGWFSEVVRKELGKTLGIIRNKMVQKAIRGGAGNAASAVLRRMYRGEYKGAVHDLGNRKRLSTRNRIVPEPNGGESGIRRHRTVSRRTKQLQKYYGPDRAFILRFLDGGTDVRVAMPSGPTGRGSMATYGNRGNIDPRGFFHNMSEDMEQAANKLGETLINHVENWTEKAFKEIEQ